LRTRRSAFPCHEFEPAELHLYAGSGHGFGVRDTDTSPSGAWPQRCVEWLVDQKLLTPR